MNSVTKKTNFFSYWYTRYLLATELYMVEPWERVVIHVLFAVLFGLFWLFNSTLVLNGLSRLRSPHQSLEQFS